MESTSSITLIREEEPFIDGLAPRPQLSPVATSIIDDPLVSESTDLYQDIEEPIEGSYQDFLAAGLSQQPIEVEPVTVEDSVQGRLATSTGDNSGEADTMMPLTASTDGSNSVEAELNNGNGMQAVEMDVEIIDVVESSFNSSNNRRPQEEVLV